MAKPHERVFAFIGALLFLASSVGVSIFVVLQMRQERKTKDAASSNTEQSANQSEVTNQSEANKLEGTKLSGFTPGEAITKLSSVDDIVGTGDVVKAESEITFHYTGALAADGTIFQSSHDGANQPVTFALGQLIPGWQQGLPGMKTGGKRRLFIPWNLGYGEEGSPQGGIPAKADLVFDIEITAVKNP